MIDSNAPAYPHTHITRDTKPGLTIRAEFAARAMQGLLANPKIPGVSKYVAEDAIAFADALISALNEKTKETT